MTIYIYVRDSVVDMRVWFCIFQGYPGTQGPRGFPGLDGCNGTQVKCIESSMFHLFFFCLKVLLHEFT